LYQLTGPAPLLTPRPLAPAQNRSQRGPTPTLVPRRVTRIFKNLDGRM
jgi:hypothetical protein